MKRNETNHINIKLLFIYKQQRKIFSIPQENKSFEWFE